MDSATILVLVLSAGVIALLAWFEVNSRRNAANTDSKSTLAHSDLEMLKKKSQTEMESDIHRHKAA
jgi:hypothetical protein